MNLIKFTFRNLTIFFVLYLKRNNEEVKRKPYVSVHSIYTNIIELIPSMFHYRLLFILFPFMYLSQLKFQHEVSQINLLSIFK